MKKFFKLLDDHFEEWIAILLLSTIVVLTFLQVIMRYVFGNSLSFSEEAARYLFVWLTFIGISYGAKNGSHMRVDLLVSVLPKAIQKCLNFIAQLFYLAFMATSFYYSCLLIQKMAKRNNYSPTMPWFHMKWLYFATVVGFGLACIRIIGKWIIAAREGKKSKQTGEGGNET